MKDLIASRQDRGFALIIVLWWLVSITLLVAEVTSAGRSEATLVANMRRAAVIEAQTDGAINIAIYNLLNPNTKWSSNEAERQITQTDVAVTLRISNESGKINPNIASSTVLAALLRGVGCSPGEARELATNIVQWRLPSADVQSREATFQKYRAAGLAYGPPNASFQSIGELGLVLGMSADLLLRLAPHLTVYTDNLTNSRKADSVVAQALELALVPPSTEPSPLSRVVTITALAVSPNGARFVRQAIVSLGLDRNGRWFRVISWTTPAL